MYGNPEAEAGSAVINVISGVTVLQQVFGGASSIPLRLPYPSPCFSFSPRRNQRDADLPHLADVHPGLLPLRLGQRAPAPVPAAGREPAEAPHPLGPDDVFPSPAVRGFLAPRASPRTWLCTETRPRRRRLTLGTPFASLSPCSHPASPSLSCPHFSLPAVAVGSCGFCLLGERWLQDGTVVQRLSQLPASALPRLPGPWPALELALSPPLTWPRFGRSQLGPKASPDGAEVIG